MSLTYSQEKLNKLICVLRQKVCARVRMCVCVCVRGIGMRVCCTFEFDFVIVQ